MARFIDRHHAEAVPNEAFARLIQEAEEQHLDSRGVRLVGQWLGDAHLYCVLEAADADSVRHNHATLGLACDDLHEIEAVQGCETAAEHAPVVRAAIASIWPTGREEDPVPGLPAGGTRFDRRMGERAIKRVLVVDDEEPIRTTVAEALTDEGYDVLTATNGAEALVLVRAAEPDGVLLDLMMPVLDGWGFLEACRHEKLCASTPVLVFSAYRRLAEAAPAELRVDRFLAKPFELEALLQAVDELVA
jgi:CheY-like chemotaxis protein